MREKLNSFNAYSMKGLFVIYYFVFKYESKENNKTTDHIFSKQFTWPDASVGPILNRIGLTC